jgi:hypothetical protein
VFVSPVTAIVGADAEPPEGISITPVNVGLDIAGVVIVGDVKVLFVKV